jgi:hypothetical protein
MNYIGFQDFLNHKKAKTGRNLFSYAVNNFQERLFLYFVTYVVTRAVSLGVQGL